MEITYTNSRADFFAHAKASQGAEFSRLAYQYYYWVVYWGLMAGLGVWVSFSADLIFVAMIFVAMYLIYFARAVPYSKVLKAALEQSVPARSPKRIRLRIDDEGLHETVEEQVESFAPWPAIRSFSVIDDHLLIELTGDLWANVPRASVEQSAAAFDEIVGLLRSRGIAERTDGKRDATASR